MLGISEISADMQDLHNLEGSDERAAKAVSLFCYQVKKWIGAFTAVLEGMDVLVFSGGIEEHSASIRSRICGCLYYAGLNWMKSKTKKMPSKFQIIRALLKCWLFPPIKS
jgi:acetate kinase